MAQKLAESFEAFAPYMEKYKELASGGRLYKVKAINVTMTGNKRLYKSDELLRSGRSLTDRGININHEKWLDFDPLNRTLDNRTLDAEYNEREQCVEAIVRIVDPLVNELYDQGKIRHVSIEGHARDADEVDGIAPLGVVFTGLAFVTDDKTPGDPNTSLQMVETIPLREIVEAPVAQVPLGEPFAGYKDFEACRQDQMSKGHDDESARKICATIMRKTEGDRGGETELSTEEEFLEDPIVEIMESISDEALDNPTLDEVKKWIQKIGLKKGALHQQLGIPGDKKIPVDVLQRAAKKKGKLGARARLALKFRKFRHCMDSVTPQEILDNVIEALVDPIEGDLMAELQKVKESGITNDQRIRADLTELRAGLIKPLARVQEEVGDLKAQVKKISETAAVKAELATLEKRLSEDFAKKQDLVSGALDRTLTIVTGKFKEISAEHEGEMKRMKDLKDAQLQEFVNVKDDQLNIQKGQVDELKTQLKETKDETKQAIEAQKERADEQFKTLLETVLAGHKRQDELDAELRATIKQVSEMHNTLGDRQALAEAVAFKGQAPPEAEQPTSFDEQDGEAFLRRAHLKRK